MMPKARAAAIDRSMSRPGTQGAAIVDHHRYRSAGPQIDDRDMGAERQLAMGRGELVEIEDLTAGGLEALKPFAIPGCRAPLLVVGARGASLDRRPQQPQDRPRAPQAGLPHHRMSPAAINTPRSGIIPAGSLDLGVPRSERGRDGPRAGSEGPLSSRPRLGCSIGSKWIE
jgi:hypothetical protein